MQKADLMREFYVNKNYLMLTKVLADTKSDYELDFLAKSYLELKEYKKASHIFARKGNLYEFGRCELLCGNFDNTRDIWTNIKEDTPASLWGKSLLEFINLYVVHVPTFFQIRAFLEVDLDALLNASQITFCENIVNGAHLFERNNQESYKFIGRVFLNNNYFDLAFMFLEKAKDICYVDPEVHFMLAKCYLHKQEFNKAKNALNISLEKGFGYFPAKRLLEQIK